MLRFSTAFFAVTALTVLASCVTGSGPTLSKVEARECRANGGFESRSPFGYPMCKFRYADAGKSCAGQSDCLGRCLSDAPENAASVAVGTPVVGRCEAIKQSFGCYASVEGGKLIEPYYCID